VFGDAVCGRAEQVVAEEVAAMAEHNEVVAAGAREVRDHLGRVADPDVDDDLDAALRGSLARRGGEGVEEQVSRFTSSTSPIVAA
jgi:hypothetical protein